MGLSTFTIFLGVYIIISSYFMQEVWITWKAMFGRNLLIAFFVFLSVASMSAILYKNIRTGFHLKKLVLLCLTCLAGFIFALRQPYLPEKAHVLEFALLGWLAMRDLSKPHAHPLRSAFIAFIFVTSIGCLEEGFQRILPWRIFEVRDIVTDLLSGALGIILFNLTQTRLSAFIRPF